MQGLSKHFDGAMFEIYRRAKSEAGYNATVFLKMLSDRGWLDTAKYLINSLKQIQTATPPYICGIGEI